MLKYGEFVNTYDDGEIKTDGKLETETGLILAVFVDTKELGNILCSQFECVNGEIFPACLVCHTHVMASSSECSNELCPSNVKQDADQIDLFKQNNEIVS
jgi:hypothetical protein